ncbi:MAG TPA: iron chelate uptake ABC transporter family permease subunit [Burkholderiaceae bacterium]
MLARGALQTSSLLLAGGIVAFVFSAVTSLLLTAPDAWRAKQAFLLGSTGFLGWPTTALLAAVPLCCALPSLWLSAQRRPTIIAACWVQAGLW